MDHKQPEVEGLIVFFIGSLVSWWRGRPSDPQVRVYFYSLNLCDSSWVFISVFVFAFSLFPTYGDCQIL
jgi:hypothetical protein